jgi:capsular exopolysaccharide synthesis family protein
VASQPELYDEIVDYRFYLELVRTVLLKYYKLITLFCAVGIIASVIYVQSQAPAYISTVTLHIAPSDAGIFNFEQWWNSDDDKFEDTQIGILQSHKLNRRVVQKISLHEAGKLTPASFDAGIANSLRQWFAGLTETPVPITEPDAERIGSTADELASLTSIAKPEGREYSNLLNITVKMADPQLAALAANTIAEEYIATVFENEVETARKNQQFLSDRLTFLRQEWKDAESRLQDYREAENIVTRSSGEDEVDEELSSLSNRYFSARENRLRQENLRQQLINIRPGDRSVEKLPAIANHPSISTIQTTLFTLNQRKEELGERYGSRHNRMIALESEINSAKRDLQVRVADVIAGISNEYELAVKIERAAEETLNSVRDRKQQLGRKEFQLNDLEQDVETKREVYSIFLVRLNEEGAAGPVRNNNLWVADPALVPGSGLRASLLRTAIIALVLSLSASVALGLVFELTSNTITTAEDVEKKLGMPLLGYLPLLAGDITQAGLTFNEYIHNPESRFSEALRTLRTSISLSTLSNKGTQRLLVTSSQSSEGKTSVALTLATAMGQTSKVLLIDGDLRRPSLERILNQSHHKSRGLSDVIAQSSTIEEATHHREDALIDVMFAGSTTLRPLELLSSREFSVLIDELSKRYDAIVIDSPPCIAVSDAYVLSTHADSVVYVTKYDQVAVPTIRTCINRFTSINASIVGIVVNQIDFEAAHYYGKYQDYYDYRGTSDETPEPEPAKA